MLELLQEEYAVSAAPLPVGFTETLSPGPSLPSDMPAPAAARLAAVDSVNLLTLSAGSSSLHLFEGGGGAVSLSALLKVACPASPLRSRVDLVSLSCVSSRVDVVCISYVSVCPVPPLHSSCRRVCARRVCQHDAGLASPAVCQRRGFVKPCS